MAKLTLQDLGTIIGNETSAVSVLNANWDLIEAAMENTLSRDGTTPNTMEADLDMNSNDILNANDVGGVSGTFSGRMTVGTLTVGGVALESEVAAAAASAAAAAVSAAASDASAQNSANSATASAASAADAAASAASGGFIKVRAATTANITIATALNSGDTLDGLTLSTNQLVLVKNQTSAAENGIYTVGAVPARSTVMDTWAKVPGTLTSVSEGTVNEDSMYLSTADIGGTIDTTNITFVAVARGDDIIFLDNAFVPAADDGATLGVSGQAWSDLFLASGGVINWNAGDVTLTHSANLLTMAGGALAIGANAFTATGTITGPSGTWDSGGMDIATGDSYAINGTDKLTATVLGSLVVTSSLTSVGILNAGSVTSGFGSIDIGASALTAGAAALVSVDIGSTIAITGVLDEDAMGSDSAVKLATQQSIKAYVDAVATAADLDIAGDTGTDAIDLDAEVLTFAGGLGITTVVTTDTVTHNIDATNTTQTNLANLVEVGALDAGSITSNFGAIDVGASAITTTGQVDGGDIVSTAALPKLVIIESDQSADEKRWELLSVAKQMRFRSINDAASSGVDFMQVNRGTGAAITNVVLPRPMVMDETLLVTGVTTHGDDVVSDTDSTDDLGTTGVRWANLFVDAITVTGNVDGRDVSTDGDKLDLIEAVADVTDATNVNSAGAIMHSDISEGEGFLRKTGSETYVATKSAQAQAVDPDADNDTTEGYIIGSLWFNTTVDKVFVAIDITEAAAVWKDISAGSGSGIANVVEDTTPELGGALDALGLNINNLNSLYFSEQAAADGDTAAKGQYWVRDDAPNTPMFTDDTGSDFVLNSGGGVRNLIINGNFIINQRVPTAAGGYTSTSVVLNSDDTYCIDRWVLLSDGDNIVDVTSLTNGSLGQYSLVDLDVETASKKFGFAQLIEAKNCTEVIDESHVVSLSFRASVTSAAAGRLDNIKAVVLSWAGTEDVMTSDVVGTWGVEDTTPTWATSYTQENVPANLGVDTTDTLYKIENIAIDTSGVKNLAVFIWADGLTGTVTDRLKITNVQLEKGPLATDFDAGGNISEVLAQCQRYFWKSWPQGSAVGLANSLGAISHREASATVNKNQQQFEFPVTMRVTPTAQEYSGDGGTINNVTKSGTGDVASTVAHVSDRMISVAADSATDGFQIVAHATATAEM